jgi:hypothetical protein
MSRERVKLEMDGSCTATIQPPNSTSTATAVDMGNRANVSAVESLRWDDNYGRSYKNPVL